MNSRTPSVSGIHILILLDLFCCYVQLEMGTHKWDPVVRHLQVPASHTSASPTDHEKTQTFLKRVVL